MRALHALAHALALAGSMTWEILWALILGFALPAIVQALVRHQTITRLLGDDRPKTLAIAAGLGAARPSCSYAAVAHRFVTEWAAVLRDIVGGRLIAGAIGAWVPDRFWRHFFLSGHPLAARFWGPIVGPLVSVISFVCSIGNVPLAAVLWNGGISFGGVVSFIFADLIILPILVIYRRYYGTRAALFIAGTFSASIVAAGYAVEVLFGLLHLVPHDRTAKVIEASIQWNY